MGRRTFQVTASVAASPEVAVDFLLDLSRHRGLHPFLTSATVVDSGVSPDGPWWDWRVEERPRLGPMRYRLRFSARMTRTSATSMTARVQAAPWCGLHSSTLAEAGGAGCRLVEKTEVTAPWPVLGYMARAGEQAHRRTFGLLPQVIGGPDPST